MNKKLFLGLAFITVIFSSCGFHNGLTTNVNNHQTDVILSNKNFKVIEKVEGQATAKYFLGIGGISKRGLIANAKSKMLANAKLIGKSRAVINETVELNINSILIYQEYIVTVSAYIIEFYNNESEVNISNNPITADVNSENKNIDNNKSDITSFEIGENVGFYDNYFNTFTKGIITNIESDKYTIEYKNTFQKSKTMIVLKKDIRKL